MKREFRTRTPARACAARLYLNTVKVLLLIGVIVSGYVTAARLDPFERIKKYTRSGTGMKVAESGRSLLIRCLKQANLRAFCRIRTREDLREWIEALEQGATSGDEDSDNS